MLIYYIFLLAAVSRIYGYNEPRIQNGEITPPDLFQFATYLHSLGSLCTASVISKRHILTAAHCIYEKESLKIRYDRYKVYLKIPYWAEVRPTGQVHDKLNMPMSIKAYLPKTYTWSQWPWNDIAILEFPEGTDFGIKPVKLAKDYLEKEGDEAYITGFGTWWIKGNKSSGASETLRHAKVKMAIDYFGGLRIAGGDATHRALSGDSGGPMVINRNNQWYQIGVSAQTTHLDVRTRVSAYCSFIEEVTKNEVKCESIYPEQKNMPSLPLKHFDPIYKGQSTPLKLFDFVIPLYNYYYNQGCTATVISKRHLLTNGWCVYRDWLTDQNKDIHLKEHLNYKSVNVKLFPDFRSKNVQSNLNNDPIDVIAYLPLNYKWPDNHNLAVIEFPEVTDFGIEPVKLGEGYIQTYLDNDTFIAAGYGKYELKNNMHVDGSPPLLLHTNDRFQFDRYTDENVVTKNENLIMRDEGGPTLIERNGKFYQIAVNYREGTLLGYRAPVSSDCDFIKTVTKDKVKCESVAPLHESPINNEDTTFNPESTNNISAMIEFNMISLLFVLVLFCL